MNKDDKFYSESITERLKEAQKYYNKMLLDRINMAMFYEGKHLDNRSWLRKCWDNLKYRIYELRLKLGEWIAGESFEDY